MSRSRTDELLEAWNMVAQNAHRPVEAPRPRLYRFAGPLGLVAAGGVAVVLIVALAIRGGAPQPSQPAVGASPSAAASPVATASPTALPTSSPSSQPSPTSSAQSVVSTASASALADEYTKDLVHGDYAAAWALLAPDGPTRAVSFADWSAERSQFFKSVAGRYTVHVPPAAGTAPLASWLAAPWGASIDQAHALLVEVDYPAIGSNAGYDLYIVNPSPSGLELYDVR